MNLHDLPTTPPKLISGSHGDYLTDQVIALIEHCWASGLTPMVCRMRTHADLAFVQRIYTKCDLALRAKTGEMKRELVHG